MTNLRTLISSTTEADLSASNTTMMAGALTLALAYTNRQTLDRTDSAGMSAGGASTGINNDARPRRRPTYNHVSSS
jgi:transcription initiation factor TFIIH subunit 3